MTAQGTHPDDFAPRGGMRGNTSEDESTEDYGSGCDSSNVSIWHTRDCGSTRSASAHFEEVIGSNLGLM